MAKNVVPEWFSYDLKNIAFFFYIFQGLKM